MVFIEFLKKHKNPLFMGFCISAFSLSMAVILLANLDWVLFMGFMTLLTPPGFSFVLFGILLLGAIMGAFLWTGLKELSCYLHERHARSTALLIETEESSALGLDETLHPLEENELHQGIIVTQNHNSQPDTALSVEDELAAFSQKANHLLARLNKPISNQEGVQKLADGFKEFKKAYYRLAQKYHPDKGAPDKVIWSTQQFQQLNAIYSEVKTRADARLENLSSKSEETLIEEENQLLRALIALLKKHLEWLKKAEEELNAIQRLLDDLDKGILKNAAGIQKLNKGIARNAEGIARNAEGINRNAQGIDRNARGIAENDAALKRNAECIERIDTTIDQMNKQQAILLNVFKGPTQKSKLTVSPGVNLESSSSALVDEEKSSDRNCVVPKHHFN